MTFSIRAAKIPSDRELLRSLLREYVFHLNDSLGSEHICWKDVEKELAALPSLYQVLLIAFVVDDEGSERAAGCVFLKSIEGGCEMKRMWVRPQFQGLGIGRKLAEALIEEARQHGYKTMYLDTVPATMKAAHHLYSILGFVPVERYNANPVPDVAFFRRDL